MTLVFNLNDALSEFERMSQGRALLGTAIRSSPIASPKWAALDETGYRDKAPLRLFTPSQSTATNYTPPDRPYDFGQMTQPLRHYTRCSVACGELHHDSTSLHGKRQRDSLPLLVRCRRTVSSHIVPLSILLSRSQMREITTRCLKKRPKNGSESLIF